MTQSLRIGLVGLGSMGRNHLRNLISRADCILVAVADRSSDLVDEAVVSTNADGYIDGMALVNEAAIDAVVIASPTTTHHALALAAIDRGLPVLVEKPIAGTVEEGAAIVARAHEHGVPLQIGHVERFNPAVLKLGEQLEQGTAGKIYSIASRRAGPFPARIRDVGVAIDLATHDADILSWVAGERPSRVYAETARRLHATNEDLLFGLLHFASGVTGMLDVNWLTPVKRRWLTVVAEEGQFELDYLTQRLVFTRSDVAQPKAVGGFATTFEGNSQIIKVENREPLEAELDAFFSVVRSGETPVVDGEDGLWALTIAASLLKSARDGIPVDPSRSLTTLTT